MKPKPRRLIEHEDLPLFSQYRGLTPLVDALPVHCPRCLALLSAGTAHECPTDKPVTQPRLIET